MEGCLLQFSGHDPGALVTSFEMFNVNIIEQEKIKAVGSSITTYILQRASGE